jgi:hypothetical protein
MIERCRLPDGVAVANAAILIEIICHMIGVDHRPEIRHMAAITVLGGAFISGRVTLCATHIDVRSGQGIGGRVVTKAAGLPACNGVAWCTGDIKIAHAVIRICLLVIVCFVT